MKLAVKFSPPTYSGGSGHTFTENLLGAIQQINPDIKCFGENVNAIPLENIYRKEIENPFSQKGFLKKITSWVNQQISFERRVLSETCDLLYCPYNYEGIYRTRKIPQVLTVHDLIPLRYPEQFPITSHLWKLIYIPTIKNSAAIITVSQNTKKDIEKFCNVNPRKIFVVPNGFLTLNRQENIDIQPNSYPYLLYVCSTHYPYKNLTKLFQAYKLISQSFPHRLIIVGKSVARFNNKIQQELLNLALTDKVSLQAGLSSCKLSDLYRNADLFVYPSLYEGFGIPPLEAMSVGVPVVASNTSSIPEVCGDAAIYVDPYSVNSIANGIIRGLSDMSLRETLRDLGYKRASVFTWEKTAQGILDVCKLVLDRQV